MRVLAGIQSVIKLGGQSVQVAPINLPSNGGIITNPFLAIDQGLLISEELFVSIVGPAALFENKDTTALQPGQQFIVPAGSYVWVNAVSSGHYFSAIFYAANVAEFPPRPIPGPFPPDKPSGLTSVIPSYLYQEYTDDDDLQAFVKSQNALQQNYVDTFNALNLPIYTGSIIKDALLDWVATGLYGYARPWVYAQKSQVLGPVNTWGPNYNVPINMLRHKQPKGVIIADDDFYKRCLTWHYQKGDGKYIDTTWLKRRVTRFLFGVNGSSPHIDVMNQISITFNPNYVCGIRFVLVIRTVTGGALPNRFGPNGTQPRRRYAIVTINGIFSTAQTLPNLPYMNQFKEAVLSGALELPFQFTYSVIIG
jgi:hypothetical protein